MCARHSLASFLLISVKRFAKTIIDCFLLAYIVTTSISLRIKLFSAKGSCKQLPFAFLGFAI